MTEPTPQQVLDTPMDPNDADAATIREYLAALLAQVWEHGEGFSGKRPFGNSGWESEVYTALVKAGHIGGSLDEDSYLEDADERAGDRLVAGAIRSLGQREA